MSHRIFTLEESQAMTRGERRKHRLRGDIVPHVKRGPRKTPFWLNIQVTDGCWLWLGSLNGYGYGYYARGPDGLAHRHMWKMIFGEIPPGMVVMHSCDNPRCVNPGHLSIGTNADNVADKIAKGRQCKGRAYPLAKLTEDNVREIRKLVDEGQMTKADIARRFNIDRALVRSISRRERWTHVE